MTKKPEIIEMKLNELKKAGYNTGEMIPSEFLQLKSSINEFGDLEPIIFNVKTKVMIDGHHRYDALIEKGINKVYAVTRGDLGLVFTQANIRIKDENQMKAMNVALRKIKGDWNFNNLESVLTDLSVSGFDLELTGFNENEIEDILVDKKMPDFDSKEGTNRKDRENIDGEGDSSKFPEVDEDIDVDYCCPKCGYEWSGKPK